MTRTSWLSIVASTVLGIALVGGLLYTVDLSETVSLLSRVDPVIFAALALLTGFNAFLAGEKWRVVALRLSHEGTRPIPRGFYFVLTAIGVALGQVVPVQVGTALSRSIGSHFYGGRAIARGAGATIFEQFFDLLVAAFLGVASAVVLLAGGAGIAWAAIAVPAAVAGYFVTALAVRLVARAAHRLGAMPALAGRRRTLGLLENVARSALLAPDVARRLFALSVLRFVVLLLMAVATTEAVGFDIALWQVAAMLPCLVLSNLIAITPGALGVNEWTAASIFVALGVPFSLAAQWAVLNRVFVAVASLLVGLVGLAMAVRLSGSRVSAV
jgi:uncharacterized membrane protein YbhN (UPF0104 family)